LLLWLHCSRGLKESVRMREWIEEGGSTGQEEKRMSEELSCRFPDRKTSKKCFTTRPFFLFFSIYLFSLRSSLFQWPPRPCSARTHL
jgi:hypothetical protein